MGRYRSKKSADIIWWQMDENKDGVLLRGANVFDVFEIASFLNTDISVNTDPISYDQYETNYGFDTRMNMPGYLSPTEFGVTDIYEGNHYIDKTKDDYFKW
tara:strand:- start:486 stop:788 length:303 start_codon:yes stop_codon:yes gene_type:complete